MQPRYLGSRATEPGDRVFPVCLHSTHSNRQFLPLVRENDSFVQVEKCNNLADDSEVFQRDL